MDEFEEFWKVYPRRVSKGSARKAWEQTQKVRPELKIVLKALYAARASKQWHKDAGDYIPYPATWLRAEGWCDEYEVDLSRLDSPKGKVCAYCAGVAQGSVNGKHACSEHWDRAMSNEKPKIISIGTKAEPEVIDMKLRSAGRD